VSKFKNTIKTKGVVHVGAHRAEELDEHLSAGAERIVWVEANPDVFGEMAVNLVGAEGKHYTFNLACTDVDDDIIDFHVIYGPDANFMTGNKGCSSILEPTERFSSWEKEIIKVPTITLDTLFDRNGLNFEDFDMIDLDVQGAELSVLKGAMKLLKSISVVVSEITFSNPDYKNNTTSEELIDFLKSQGFVMLETYMHDPNWGDALFVKES